jgi:hypothetical protein
VPGLGRVPFTGEAARSLAISLPLERLGIGGRRGATLSGLTLGRQ